MLENIHAPVPSIQLFQSFVSELIALKWSVQRAPAEAGTIEVAVENGNGGSGGEARPNAIWNRVVALLDQQALEATRLSGPSGLEFHREAIYVMAALADEIFVHLDWEGKDFWLNHLLEARLFRTHAAGTIFFRKVEDILRRQDEAAAEMATVFMFALALGFRGKYWGDESELAPDVYRARLFAFIARRLPDLSQPVQHVFPAAYRNTIQSGSQRDIPSARPWVWGLLGAFLAWIVIAQLLWWNLTRDLNAKLCATTPTCAAQAPPSTPAAKPGS
jgi:type VI secretion system protein ImpK